MHNKINDKMISQWNKCIQESCILTNFKCFKYLHQSYGFAAASLWIFLTGHLEIFFPDQVDDTKRPEALKTAKNSNKDDDLAIN